MGSEADHFWTDHGFCSIILRLPEVQPRHVPQPKLTMNMRRILYSYSYSPAHMCRDHGQERVWLIYLKQEEHASRASLSDRILTKT